MSGNNAGFLQTPQTWNGSEWVGHTYLYYKGDQFAWPDSYGPIAKTVIYDQLPTSTLTGGQALYADRYVQSNSGEYMLVMQEDGNLVLYNTTNGTALWSSHTQGNPGAYLAVQSDGNVVVSDANGNPLWAIFNYDPGNYVGKSSSVSVVDYQEPLGSQYYNYCGPGASQVLISAWTSNVPNIETLAQEEQTYPNSGTAMANMVGPINSAIGQNYYSIHYASTQGAFSNMIGRDILDNHHPLITGLLTIYGNNHLIGWSNVSAPHIITITGFDFTSPSQGWIYYTETASVGAGAMAGRVTTTHRLQCVLVTRPAK